jgi:hypothetical protein
MGGVCVCVSHRGLLQWTKSTGTFKYILMGGVSHRGYYSGLKVQELLS